MPDAIGDAIRTFGCKECSRYHAPVGPVKIHFLYLVRPLDNSFGKQESGNKVFQLRRARHQNSVADAIQFDGNGRFVGDVTTDIG